MSLPIIYHPLYSVPFPERHRFPMAKFARLMAVLRADDLATTANVVEPTPVAPEWLEAVHDPAYVRAVFDGTLDDRRRRRIGVPLDDHVLARSRVASGGTVLTARLALARGLACNTAGGSHHAGPDGGAGFCIFNDVAVAAQRMLDERLVRQVLIVDLDVHQGDGTAAIFRDQSAVFTFSMHAARNFPARKQESDLDVALDDATGDGAYLDLLEEHLAQALDRARPDLVFYLAGVDPHIDDLLGRLSLSDRGLAAREHMVIDACLSRGVPVATVIGGGYARDIDALARRHARLHHAAARLFDAYRL